MPPASKYTSDLAPRKCQREVLDLVFGAKKDEDKLYIVSPPGSGKTLTGLMIAAEMDVPAVVLVPNTAIQAQWIEKSRQFKRPGAEAPFASINPGDAAPVTVLTYQMLARTRDISEEERSELLAAWVKELVEAGDSEEDAAEWLKDYENNNPDRFYLSLMRRFKARRYGQGAEDASGLVSEDAAGLMRDLRGRGVRLVIFDECHHLLGYWAQVALALVRTLDRPRILGLTATPPLPDDLDDREFELHRELLHDIDYKVVAPAVIKDGNLAPYQDLVFFTRPSPQELSFIRNCSQSLKEAIECLEKEPAKKMSEWLRDELREIAAKSSPYLLRKRAAFIEDAALYLRQAGEPVPEEFDQFMQQRILCLEDKASLAGIYAVKYLLVSGDESERQLFRKLAVTLRPLGYQLTEKGLRNCQSSVNRILGLSSSKIQAAVEILGMEIKSSGSEVRALVISDFERSSATIPKEIANILTEESGGSVAAMKALTSDAATDGLDPIMVTGRSVYVDDDLLVKFMAAAGEWFSSRKLEAGLSYVQDGTFHRIEGMGRDWNTRNYVTMITEFFEKGLTRCLVGTRGLLGEGWDSLTANTLVDLTCAATAMTVNQLRGRAVRLDPSRVRKVSNIWDVVCMAPEFDDGLSDYARFAKKHANYYGICDDGAIEFGLGHIHPALTEAGPEDVALSCHIFNDEMRARCADRQRIYALWKIGEPYENKEIKAAEVKLDSGFDGAFLSQSGRRLRRLELDYTGKIKNICSAVFDALCVTGKLKDKKAKMRVNERADRYFRAFLESSSEEDIQLFASCLDELFQPVAEQKYIIPRYEQILKDRWFSKFLPAILHKYVAIRINRIAVYHPLPECFSDSRENADVFSKKWNIYVSPGRAVFTKRGEGEKILADARTGGMVAADARAKIKSLWK